MAEWREVPNDGVVPGARVWQRDLVDGHLSVILSRDDGSLHMSISHRLRDLSPGRYPSWNEIREARYRFCPDDVTMAMLLPPKAEYVNLHPTAFHLWEWPDT